ncbi:MAG: type IV secretory system conjugative DNA transfer family protein, partial [Proteobacteria bacterium]|nr:type IV secretory system conjugative DNA transfer family protein [Pseudomonadota bacterium]
MSRFASAPWPLKAVYLGALGAAAAGVATAVALAVALAGLRRLGFTTNLSAAPAWFWYFRADPEVRRWLAIGAASALTIVASILLAIGLGARPPLHGAARWASEGDVTRAGLRARRGIVLGRKAGRPLVFGGDEHALLYAPTRSGKGVGVVIPNLLTWPDSLVVLDIKRENWDASAGYRAAHGQEVILFDPLEPEGRTARFNPLGHIDRTDAVAVLDELQKLAVMLLPAPAGADPFWAEAARTGFIGVGAYVAETTELTFSLGQVYAELTQGDPRARLAAIIATRAKGARPLSAGCASALAD